MTRARRRGGHRLLHGGLRRLFSLYYLLYTRRRFDVVLDRELLAYLGILLGAVLFVWGVLVFEGVYEVSSWVEHCATRPSRS